MFDDAIVVDFTAAEKHIEILTKDSNSLIYFTSYECSAYRGNERCAQGFGGETRGKETT